MSSFRRPLTIIRKSGKPVLDQATGKFIDQDEHHFKVNASVQPMKPNEMQALPEGRRGSRAVKVYSDVELYEADQKSGLQSDKFYWLGILFEVVASDAYQADVLSHYRAYATEVQSH